MSCMVTTSQLVMADLPITQIYFPNLSGVSADTWTDGQVTLISAGEHYSWLGAASSMFNGQIDDTMYSSSGGTDFGFVWASPVRMGTKTILCHSFRNPNGHYYNGTISAYISTNPEPNILSASDWIKIGTTRSMNTNSDYSTWVEMPVNISPLNAFFALKFNYTGGGDNYGGFAPDEIKVE